MKTLSNFNVPQVTELVSGRAGTQTQEALLRSLCATHCASSHQGGEAARSPVSITSITGWMDVGRREEAVCLPSPTPVLGPQTTRFPLCSHRHCKLGRPADTRGPATKMTSHAEVQQRTAKTLVQKVTSYLPLSLKGDSGDSPNAPDRFPSFYHLSQTVLDL